MFVRHVGGHRHSVIAYCREVYYWFAIVEFWRKLYLVCVLKNVRD